MKRVNIFEVKAKLSELIELAERGERVLICRRNHPVAELRPIARTRTTERPLGGSQIELPESFFAPLPADVEDTFYGGPGTQERGASPAAERPATLDGAPRQPRRAKQR
jgi:prevent-host-death family protein